MCCVVRGKYCETLVKLLINVSLALHWLIFRLLFLYFLGCFVKANVFIGLGLTLNIVAFLEAFVRCPVCGYTNYTTMIFMVVIRIDYYRSVLFFSHPK